MLGRGKNEQCSSRQPRLTSVVWTVRSVVSEVPFPNNGGVIPSLLQQLGQSDFRKRQASHRVHSKVMSHSISEAITACKDGSTRWRTGRSGGVEV
ncbi:hypothetical protein XENOCAPTIV_025333, partial [Xenoophorus captivus]